MIKLFFKTRLAGAKVLLSRQECRDTLSAALFCLFFFIAWTLGDYISLHLAGVNNTVVNPFMQSLPFYLLLLSPLFVLGKWAKPYAVFITNFVMLICLTEIISACLFKSPVEGDVFGVISASSVKEVKEFFQRHLLDVRVIMLFLSGAALSAATVWFICKRRFTVNRVFLLLALLLALPYAITFTRYCMMKKMSWERIFGRNQITNIIYGYCDYYQNTKQLQDCIVRPKIPDQLRSIAGGNGEFLGIVVIGESASRHHFGIYGYPRPTTPQLCSIKNDLIIFNDVLSPYASTVPALKMGFTFADLNNSPPECSIVDICNAAGFETVLISNQYRWGPYDGPVSLLFNNASKRVYITELDRNSYDSRIVPVLREVISKRKKKCIIFLHLIGNHDDYKNRYPSEFAKFSGLRDKFNDKLPLKYAELYNEYDNSVLFEDYVLSQFLEALAMTKGLRFMLFFSDHAETIEDGAKVFRTGRSKYPENYEIPFFIWLSPEYKKLFPDFVADIKKSVNKPLQTDKLIYVLLDLFRLRYTGFPEEKNVFSPAYKPVQRYIGGVEYEKTRINGVPAR